jgi:hypothetical protein
MGIFDKVKQMANTTVNLNEFTINTKEQLDKVKKISDNTIQSIANKTKNDLKSQIIKQVTNINYSIISSTLRTVNNVHPIPDSVILNLELLRDATDNYKQSTTEKVLRKSILS